MDEPTREMRTKINRAFLEMTLRLIEKNLRIVDREVVNTELIKETRECFKLVRELGF